jgi:hypothetical protein
MNAHIRNVPDRKTMSTTPPGSRIAGSRTDQCQLVPPAPIQELRDLARTRKQLVWKIPQHSLRILKTPKGVFYSDFCHHAHYWHGSA